MNDDEKPVLTEQRLYEYLAHQEGLPVSRRTVHWAVLRREILPTRLGKTNYFSKRDGLDWIASRRQKGVYRAPNAAAAQ